MNEAELEILSKIPQVETPEDIRDFILLLGFNGIFFQRWYPSMMDNWEGALPSGFLEHYYGAQLYKWCPVARVIHQWHRSYTFSEARNEILCGDENAIRATNLWRQFGMDDGIIVFSGRQELKSAMIVTTAGDAEDHYNKHSKILAYLAALLDEKLPQGHPLLGEMSRGDPILSEMQNKILQLQIDHPNDSNTEMASRLGISPKTLAAHHKKIARKAGVTTFTGAVIQKLKTTILD